jgi:hypothetical protein
MTTTANGGSTATVETLTPEVRVLQVGNRQVTMSVAKQLDSVPLAEIEVFGRVSVSVWGSDRDNVELIGRSTNTGALVRSFAGLWSTTAHRVDSTRLAELKARPLIVLAGLR